MNFKMKISNCKLKIGREEILRPRALRLAPDGLNAMPYALCAMRFFGKGFFLDMLPSFQYISICFKSGCATPRPIRAIESVLFCRTLQ
jgi:hypothetical protein